MKLFIILVLVATVTHCSDKCDRNIRDLLCIRQRKWSLSKCKGKLQYKIVHNEKACFATARFESCIQLPDSCKSVTTPKVSVPTTLR
jgi:hypothetical protein